MVANLNFNEKGQAAMAYTGTVPWHGLGTKIDHAMTSLEALGAASLVDWQLTKIQQHVWLGSEGDGEWKPTNMHAIVRMDRKVVLGSVGSKYKIVTNEQCFDFMDKVIEGGARYETAGALGNGEKVWMLAKMPEAVEVAKDDKVESFILCTTSHDGSGAVKVYPTTVRVVCQNTLGYAESSRGRTAGFGLNMKHTENVMEKVKQAQEVLGLARKSFAKFSESAKFLAGVQVQPEPYFADCLDFITNAFVGEVKVTQGAIRNGKLMAEIAKIANPEERAVAEIGLDRALTRRVELLDDIVGRYESDRNNNSVIAGSGWAAFNALSEHLDHSYVYRYNSGIDASKRFEALIYGRGEAFKQMAWSRVIQLAQGV